MNHHSKGFHRRMAHSTPAITTMSAMNAAHLNITDRHSRGMNFPGFFRLTVCSVPSAYPVKLSGPTITGGPTPEPAAF